MNRKQTPALDDPFHAQRVDVCVAWFKHMRIRRGAFRGGGEDGELKRVRTAGFRGPPERLEEFGVDITISCLRPSFGIRLH